MKKYITHNNVKQVTGEVNTLPSKTVPNQTETIQQMYARITRGQEVFKNRQIFSEIDGEDAPKAMIDLTDLDEARAQLEEVQIIIKNKQKQKKVPPQTNPSNLPGNVVPGEADNERSEAENE